MGSVCVCVLEGGVAWGEVWNLLDLPFRRSIVKCAGRMRGYRTASRDVSGRLASKSTQEEGCMNYSRHSGVEWTESKVSSNTAGC